MQDSVQSTAPAARARSSADDVKAEVRRLLPAIRAKAAETERARRVPDEHVEALRSIGFFKLVQPAAFGGDEHDFAMLADLIMEIAQACASTAWVCGLLSAHQWMLGLFAAEAQRDVWGRNPDALLCGSYAPACDAVAEAGGYRISGRWSFASGCDNSQWAFCAARLPATQDRASEPAFFLVARADWVIDDTWDTIGLAGTGSKTIVLDNAFVPAHRLLLFADAAAGRSPGSRLYKNRLFAIPIYCQLSPCLAAAGIGAAMGALEDFIAATGKRLTRGSVTGGNNRMAEFPTIQIKVAEAAAAIDAARFILLRDFEAIAREIREQGEATTERRVTNRRGQAYAVSLAVRAADVLNAATGGNGLAMSNPIQRAWRDVNAVGRHVSLNWDSVAAMYGQMALGLEPRGQY
jgi:alkylation response protein AidB-like acyl-CoA dehydrogenase